jgi:plasmid stabilization system protein ParE
MGVARPDVMPDPFRFFLERPYWIVYEPGEPLLIHRVFHAARDLNRLNLK